MNEAAMAAAQQGGAAGYIPGAQANSTLASACAAQAHADKLPFPDSFVCQVMEAVAVNLLSRLAGFLRMGQLYRQYYRT